MDERDRERQRRLRAAGDPADAAALIVARLRTGALSREVVVRAARLGHLGACHAVAVTPPDRDTWISTADAIDATRAAVAAARVALPIWEDERGGDGTLRRALELVVAGDRSRADDAVEDARAARLEARREADERTVQELAALRAARAVLGAIDAHEGSWSRRRRASAREVILDAIAAVRGSSTVEHEDDAERLVHRAVLDALLGDILR